MTLDSRYSVIDVGIYIVNKAVDEKKDLDYIKLTQLVYMVNTIYYKKHQRYLYNHKAIKKINQINGRIDIPDLYQILKKTYVYDNILYPFTFDKKIKTYVKPRLTINKDDKFNIENVVYDVEKDMIGRMDSKDKLFIDNIYNKYINNNHEDVCEMILKGQIKEG